MGVKEEKVELDGEILEAFGGGMFKIAFENGHEAIGYTSGKIAATGSGWRRATRSRRKSLRTTRPAAASSTGNAERARRKDALVQRDPRRRHDRVRGRRALPGARGRLLTAPPIGRCAGVEVTFRAAEPGRAVDSSR